MKKNMTTNTTIDTKEKTSKKLLGVGLGAVIGSVVTGIVLKRKLKKVQVNADKAEALLREEFSMEFAKKLDSELKEAKDETAEVRKQCDKELADKDKDIWNLKKVIDGLSEGRDTKATLEIEELKKKLTKAQHDVDAANTSVENKIKETNDLKAEIKELKRRIKNAKEVAEEAYGVLHEKDAEGEAEIVEVTDDKEALKAAINARVEEAAEAAHQEAAEEIAEEYFEGIGNVHLDEKTLTSAMKTRKDKLGNVADDELEKILKEKKSKDLLMIYAEDIDSLGALNTSDVNIILASDIYRRKIHDLEIEKSILDERWMSKKDLASFDSLSEKADQVIAKAKELIELIDNPK